MTGKWHGLVIDTPDPHGLATFYQELLGFVRVQDDDHWVVIGDSAEALSLGAARLPGGGPTFRVYRDPSGHPFCLCL